MKSLLLKTAILAVVALVSFSGTASADVLPGVHDDYPIPGEGCPEAGDSGYPPFLRTPPGPFGSVSKRFEILP